MTEQQRNNPTPLEIIATILGIVVSIAFLISILKKKPEDEEEIKATKSRDKLYNKIAPTYEDFVYKDFADTLDTALLRSTTEDEDAVYTVFRTFKNISDVNKLIEAFGVRRQIFSTLYLSLPQAINETFNKKEISTLNHILESNKIPYTFN